MQSAFLLKVRNYKTATISAPTCVPFRFLCYLLHKMSQYLKCSQNSRFAALMAVRLLIRYLKNRRLPGTLCSRVGLELVFVIKNQVEYII